MPVMNLGANRQANNLVFNNNNLYSAVILVISKRKQKQTSKELKSEI